jgi:hypothetical protein
MYNGLAHTGFGALLLTAVALLMGAVGGALRFIAGRSRG